MKKIIAVILCMSVFASVCIPAAFANEETLPESGMVQETPETELPEEDETPVEPDEPIEPEEEKESYSERFERCIDGGVRNLGVGALLVGAALTSPILMLAFPPIGVSAALAGVPLGVFLMGAGLGEIVTSPVLALFIDEDTQLELM